VSPGFTIVYSTTIKKSDALYTLPVGEDAYHIWHHTHGRFPQDNLCARADGYIVGLEGIIYNVDSIPREDRAETLLSLYRGHGADMPRQIRGVYLGIVLDVQKGELLAYADSCGSLPCFYSCWSGGFVMSSDIGQVLEWRRKHGMTCKLHEQMAYYMLTMGCVIEDDTLVEDVYRLHGGDSIMYSPAGSVRRHHYARYRDISYEPVQDYSAMLEQMDAYLCRSVDEATAVDRHYGRQSLTTISGGIDSRFVLMRQVDQGADVRALCFSHPGYEDEHIAREICRDVDVPLDFISLDMGRYTERFDQNMSIFQGQIFYLTSAHFRYALDQLEDTSYGLIHTGILGGSAVGSSLKYPVDKANLKSRCLSKILWDRCSDHAALYLEQHTHPETAPLLARSMNMTISGAWCCAQESYGTSPFMDLDFIELMLSVPPSRKKHRRVMIDWMHQHHPTMTSYRWEALKMKPFHPMAAIMGRYKSYALARLHQIIGRKQELSMTPFSHWDGMRPEMREWYGQQISTLSSTAMSDQLREDIKMMQSQAGILELSQILTLLGAIDRFKLTT